MLLSTYRQLEKYPNLRDAILETEAQRQVKRVPMWDSAVYDALMAARRQTNQSEGE
jgi:hypothetical protein